MDFREEFLRNHETAYGTEQLTDAVSFEEWLKNVQRNEKKETAENGRPPSYEFMGYPESRTEESLHD